MTLVFATLLGAIAAGWIVGGRLRRLADVQIARAWLLAIAVVAQMVLAFGGEDVAGSWGPVLLGCSHVALLAFLWANRLLPGMTLVFSGLALNAVVITANGGMPVSPEALRALGAQAELETGKHLLLTDGTFAPFLADVLPVPPLRTIVSIGDILLAAGVGLLVVGLMRTRQHRGGAQVSS